MQEALFELSLQVECDGQQEDMLGTRCSEKRI